MSETSPSRGGGPATATSSHHCDTDALNAALRGERAAVETYDWALPKFNGDPADTDLRIIREEHHRSADALRDHVRQFGGVPSDDAGMWGAFAAALTGAAKMIGTRAVLTALKQGEEQGVNDYQAVLGNPAVADECKFLIRSELLPRCHQHIAILDRLTEDLDT